MTTGFRFASDDTLLVRSLGSLESGAAAMSAYGEPIDYPADGKLKLEVRFPGS